MAFDPSRISAPFRMQPGLRRRPAGAPHFHLQGPGDDGFAAKLAVLTACPWQALCVRPGWDAGPALGTVLRRLRLEHPVEVDVDWADDAEGAVTAGASAGAEPDGDGGDDADVGVRASAQRDAGTGDAARTHGHARLAMPRSVRLNRLGWRLSAPQVAASWDGVDWRLDGDGPAEIGDCLRALPAHWRLPALLSLGLEEDLAVLDGDDATIPWLAVCLPSHGAPEDKVGRHFAQVHAPVADNALLLQAGASLARLVCGPHRWERDVWTLTSDGALDAHPRRAPRASWPDPRSPEALAGAAWLRTEHQAFLPVAGGRQAVFTIHVQRRPLIDWARSPDGAPWLGRLRDAIATMSDAVLRYRGLAEARDGLVAWLDAEVTSRPLDDSVPASAPAAASAPAEAAPNSAASPP